MAHEFDPGYSAPPWDALVRDYPGTDIYPHADFRTEWGPIFHRGRLDGTARILCLGQDPGQHESCARRILVGEAGQRVQGFLAKLGIRSSYLMLNTFLYSVYGQQGGERHRDDKAIAAYRNRWLDAAFETSQFQAVIAFGSLAKTAWEAWPGATVGGSAAGILFLPLTHPTQPESASKGDAVKLAVAMRKMLVQWNHALDQLAARVIPDASVALVHYGDSLTGSDLVEVPEADLPAGMPPWMRGLENWAERGDGKQASTKRARLTITVPNGGLG